MSLKVEQSVWIAASRERVWRAITDPEQLSQWWSPHRWEIPLAEGQSLEQVFTVSGRVEQFSVERLASGAAMEVPARDGVVLRVVTQE